MYLRVLSLLAVFLLRSVVSETDDEVKKGQFPYMAFIYYADDAVVDKNGARLTRAGILIKPNWLITSSLETDDVSMAFPKKTLIARLGSVSVDDQFTVNEDEDEQEREIIQISRPYNFRLLEWWLSDISLLKTLLPFNKTSAVGSAAIATKYNPNDKDCFILVYAKLFNKTKERYLTQIAVEVLPSPTDRCGSHFSEKTMICALDQEDTKNVTYDSDFCIGNGGGPLVCGDIIYGLQTYSRGCREPHLYQLFPGWQDFISFGLQGLCQEKNGDKVCTVISKDSEKISTPMALDAQVIYTNKTTEIAAVNENNDSGEAIASDRPTATTEYIMKDTITQAIRSYINDVVEKNSSTASAEVQSVIEEDSRRTNVEAQKETMKKKSSASMLIPFATPLPILFWITINFAYVL